MNRVIAVDIDEVLVPFFPTLTKYYTWRTNKQVHLPAKFAYHYAPLFNITEEESSELVKDFYSSDFHKSMKPIVGAKRRLHDLAKNNTLIAVTGRQSYARDATEELLLEHFGGDIQDIIYCDHFTKNARNKAEVCSDISADLLIDDSYQSCMDCLNISIPAINFIGQPTYAWCKPNPVSVPGWGHKYFDLYL